MEITFLKPSQERHVSFTNCGSCILVDNFHHISGRVYETKDFMGIK